MTIRNLILAGLCASACGCAHRPSGPVPSAAGAKAFLATANATTLKLGIQQSEAGWVQETFITEKIAFLPFGLLIDQWRWKVFAGEISPAEYNKAYWDLKLKYQGVAPPSARGEQFFDPGAKYHVPDNTPYTRYFLADILQFQFHRALAKAAGCTLPLNRCSIYESKAAGERLNRMLSMGQSKPWPDALEALTGSKQMDATAILDYFAPLSKWLDEHLKDAPVGW